MPISRLLAAVLVVAATVSVAAQGKKQVACCAPDMEAVVAVVDGRPILMSELEDHSRSRDPRKLLQLSQLLYEFRLEMLGELVNERLLAKEAAHNGVSVDHLLENVKAEPATEADLRAEFDRVQKAPRPDGSPPPTSVRFEDVRPQIAKYVSNQRLAKARQDYLALLKTKYASAIDWRLDVTRQSTRKSESDPTLGAGDVKVVLFSDFECPYCKAAMPVVTQLVSLFPGKVELIWKDYPSPSRPKAMASAEAARCAHEQGRFWAYGDALFRRQGGITREELSLEAKELGLNSAAFDACVNDRRHQHSIADSVREGESLGVSATPTVFVNGRAIVGFAPIEVYRRIIEQEIALVRR